MGFPDVLGRINSASTTNSTSHTVDFPAVPTDGDLLIVFAVWDGNITPTWPTGWTQVFLRRSNGSEITAECRYRVADGDGSSITITTPSEEMVARCWQIEKGTFARPPEIEAATAAGSSTTPDPPSLTPTWGSDKDGWLALIGADASGVVSNPPANYVRAGAGNSGGGGGVGAGYGERLLEAASEDPAAVTLTPTGPWVAATVALRGRTAASVRDDVAAWVEARLAALASLQATYAANHGGRYFQGVRRIVPEDGRDVDSDDTLKPHDQAESWADVGANIPARVPCALEVNVYQVPGGDWGYTVRAIVVLGGSWWIRVWGGADDPLGSGTDWYEDIEPVV